jgi:hypothetical protein
MSKYFLQEVVPVRRLAAKRSKQVVFFIRFIVSID